MKLCRIELLFTYGHDFTFCKKLIPKSSLAAALKYVDLSPEDVNIIESTDEKEESFEDLLRGMD